MLFRLASSSQTSSRLSSSQGQGIRDSQYHGVGYVGYADEDEDTQQRLEPSYSQTASRYSSSRHSEADEIQQRVQPDYSSSAYRSQGAQDDDELQRTVGPTSSRTFSRDESLSNAQRNSFASSSQRSNVALSDLDRYSSQKPIPTGQYVSLQARPGTATVLAMPVRVISTHVVPADTQKVYSRTSEQSTDSESSSSTVQLPTSTTYRVTYTPSRNVVTSDKLSASRDSDVQRTYTAGTQPEKFTSYNSFNSLPESASQTQFVADSRSSQDDVQTTQQRVSPAEVTGPTYGGNSRFSSTGSGSAGSQSRTSGTAYVVPSYSSNTAESSSSRTAEEREQRRYTPSRPTYISSTNSRVSADSVDQQATGSSSYVPASRTQTQYQAGSGSQTQSQSQYTRPGQTYSPYAPSRSQTGSASTSDSSRVLSQRVGSSVYDSNDDDLQTYMTESEKLARAQQQQNNNYGSTQSGYSRTASRSRHDDDLQVHMSESDRLAALVAQQNARSSQNSNTQQRIGAGVYGSTASTDDLRTYMTEAERLARIQQQQLSGSTQTSYLSNSNANRRTLDAASRLDSAAASFVRPNLANRNSELDAEDTGAGTGGYTRVKQWNKQSSWSSGKTRPTCD